MTTQTASCKSPDGTCVRWHERTGDGRRDAISDEYVRSFVRDVVPLLRKGCVIEYSHPDGSLARNVREEIEAQSAAEPRQHEN